MTPSELPEYKWSPSNANAVTSPSCLWLASLIKSIFATILFAFVCNSLSFFFLENSHSKIPNGKKRKLTSLCITLRCLMLEISTETDRWSIKPSGIYTFLSRSIFAMPTTSIKCRSYAADTIFLCDLFLGQSNKHTCSISLVHTQWPLAGASTIHRTYIRKKRIRFSRIFRMFISSTLWHRTSSR